MSRFRIIIISIFIFSMGLRLVLCFVNRQANDDHMEVINWIVDKHEIPTIENCPEAFQPKIFYLMSAGVINLLSIDNNNNRIICVQLINFIFSFFILLFLWMFISRHNVSRPIK